MTWPTPYRPVPPELLDTPEQIAARRAVLDELRPCRRRQRESLAADWQRTAAERRFASLPEEVRTHA